MKKPWVQFLCWFLCFVVLLTVVLLHTGRDSEPAPEILPETSLPTDESSAPSEDPLPSTQPTPQVTKDTFRVIGNTDWLGNWDPTSDAGLMEEIGNGQYQKCYTNVFPGVYEFKVSKNGTWEQTWGDENGCNVIVPIINLCDLTILFDSQQGIIQTSCSPEQPPVEIPIEPSEETEPIPETTKKGFRVVGSTDWMGNWDPAADIGLMKDIGNGQYEKRYENVPPGTYDFKITQNGVWDKQNSTDDHYSVNVAVTCQLTILLDIRQRTVETFCSPEQTSEEPDATEPPVFSHPPTDPAQIMAEAAALREGEELLYNVTLSGKVTAINDPYNPDYQNITLTIAVADTDSELRIYRLKGYRVETLCTNDHITVTGRIRSYKGVLELFDCTLDSYNKYQPNPLVLNDAWIIDQASQLDEGQALPYVASITGTVTAINTPYDADTHTIQVTLCIPSREHLPILCCQMTGENLESLTCGDTITVSGYLHNDHGTIQFNTCTMSSCIGP